jgi:hypothetical protein
MNDGAPGCVCLPANDTVDEMTYFFSWNGGSSRQLVDGSHLIVSIRQCAYCRTDHVHAMAEKVDWVGGNDAQQRIRFMIYASETLELERTRDRGENIESEVQKLASQRGYFEAYWPSSGDPVIRCATGPFVFMPHD